MSQRLALLAATAAGAALAAPGVANAQLPVPPAPPLPAPPAVPLPPRVSTDPVTGVVTTVEGTVLGVLDPVTGQLVPAPSPPPAASDPEAESGAAKPPSPATTAPRPTTTTAPSVRDTTAPRLQLRVDRHTDSPTARRSGIRVVARCSEDCTATLRVLRGTQVGRKRVKLAKMRTYVLKVKLNRRGRAVAAKVRRTTKLRVTGRAVDTAGNLSSTVRKTAYVRAVRRR
jgi:hypothetical protein